MGEQIRRHEAAVTVPGRGDPRGIGDAERDRLVDCRLRAGGDLLDIRVVDGLRIADDRDRDVVEDGVARERQEDGEAPPRVGNVCVVFAFCPATLGSLYSSGYAHKSVGSGVPGV